MIELVVVIIIMGILAAVAIPRLVDVSGAAAQVGAQEGRQSLVTAWEEGMVLNASSAPANPYPTLANVVANMSGGSVKAGTGSAGVCVSTGYVVKTFKDTAGTVATSATTDQIKAFADTPVTDAGC